MVLDHATQDIVSLAEFEERTKLRYVQRPVLDNVPRSVEQLEPEEQAVVVVDGPQKRKANDEGDEGGMAEKRARL